MVASTADVARNKVLTAVAAVLQRGDVTTGEAAKAAVTAAAQEVAKEHAGVAVADLMEAVPKQWTDDPASPTTRSEATAFLQIAGTVLGVNVGAMSAIATRSRAAGGDIALAVAVNRAQAASASTSSALLAPLDLQHDDPRKIKDALEQALQDKDFADVVGGKKYTGPRLLAGATEVAAALDDLRPRTGPRPTVSAGGVLVAGPSVDAARAARPFGHFVAVPGNVSAGALALIAAELVLVRHSLGEVAIRSAIAGKPVNFISGHVPYPSPFEIHAALATDGSGRVALGLSIDLAALRKFMPTDLDDAALTKSVGAMLRSAFEQVDKLRTDKGIPPGLSTDRSVTESPAWATLTAG